MGNLIRGYKKEEFSSPSIIWSVDIGPYAKMAYMYLQYLMDVEGKNMPSYNEIAYYCKVSKSSIRRGIDELVEVGLVNKYIQPKADKSNDPNLYEVLHPKQVEGLKMLPPFEEVKYKKKKAKRVSSENTGFEEEKTHALTEHGLKNHALTEHGLGKSEENQEVSETDEKTHALTEQVTSTSLDLVSNSLVEDTTLTDEEMIQVAYKEHIGQEITFKQAETFVDLAVQQNLSLDEVVEEIKYTAKMAKKNPSGHLYKSLAAGGYYKTKLEKEAEKAKQEAQKPKRRLVRKKPGNDKLPEMLKLQLEGNQPQEQVDPEEQERKVAEVKAKLQEMRERFKTPVI